MNNSNNPPILPQPIHLTPRAAEQIKIIIAEDDELNAPALRVAVVGGGCSGLKYFLDFDEGKGSAFDMRWKSEEVEIVIDIFSSAHLAGTTIDYLDTLNESGFKFNNPNAIRTCGCSKSFIV